MAAKPSGTKTFLIQDRHGQGRSRRCVIDRFGVLTVEIARGPAQKKRASVVDGRDPSCERRAARQGVTVAEACDWYLVAAEAGRLLGRNRRPIKATLVAGDRGRIGTHIKPLIGTRAISQLKRVDMEHLQADIVGGKTARTKRPGCGGPTLGGAGVAR
jgi:hypothetical protein